MLTMQALKHRKITVFGGKQIRPNIHLRDMIAVYQHLLKNPQIEGVYNAGFENVSILDIAKKIQENNACDIEITESNDPRSYRLNSDRLLNTGFRPQYSFVDGIQEISQAVAQGRLQDQENSYNLKVMKSLNL